MGRPKKVDTSSTGVVAVTNGCPMCRDEINRKSGRYVILSYKRIYIKGCENHLAIWDEADAADRKKN